MLTECRQPHGLWLLPHGDIGAAGLTVAVIAAIAIAVVRPVWPPKILNATSVVLFAVLAIAGFTGSAGTDGGWPAGPRPASAWSSWPWSR